MEFLIIVIIQVYIYEYLVVNKNCLDFGVDVKSFM